MVKRHRRSNEMLEKLQNIKKHKMKVMIPPVPYSMYLGESVDEDSAVMFMAPDDGIISRVTLDIGDIILKEGADVGKCILAVYRRDNSIETEVHDLKLEINDIDCSLPLGRGDKFTLFFRDAVVKEVWMGYVFIVKIRKEYMVKVLMDSGYNVIGIK